MDVLLDFAVVVLAVGMFAGTLLVFPAMWQGFRRPWERAPVEARRRGAVGGTLAAVYIVAGSAVALAEPWGSKSVLYVIAVGGGALMLLMLVGVLIHAVTETRRTR